MRMQLIVTCLHARHLVGVLVADGRVDVLVNAVRAQRQADGQESVPIPKSYVLAQESVSLACRNASDHNGYSHLFVLLENLVVLVRTRVVLLGARDEEQNVCEALDRIDVPAHHHISAVQCSAAMQSACWQSIGQQPTLATAHSGQ